MRVKKKKAHHVCVCGVGGGRRSFIFKFSSLWRKEQNKKHHRHQCQPMSPHLCDFGFFSATLGIRSIITLVNINTLNCPLVTSQAYRICAMGSEMQHDPEIGGCREHQWAKRSLRLQFMDLLPAFESGNFHDCTIRVGCDLQNSDASFRVSDAKQCLCLAKYNLRIVCSAGL